MVSFRGVGEPEVDISLPSSKSESKLSLLSQSVLGSERCSLCEDEEKGVVGAFWYQQAGGSAKAEVEVKVVDMIFDRVYTRG